MAEVTCRELGADEARYVVDVCSLKHCRGFVTIPRIEQVVGAMKDTSAKTFVVEAGGVRVGIVRLAWPAGWLVELKLIAIEHPGRGFGSAALQWAQRFAFETLRAHRMYLEAAAGNVIARRLYERFGFRKEGVWRDGFRGDEGAYQDLFAYGMLETEYAPT